MGKYIKKIYYNIVLFGIKEGREGELMFLNLKGVEVNFIKIVFGWLEKKV